MGAVFAAGQTFLYPLAPNLTAHLWVISTDPTAEGYFAAVACTSLKGAKDQTVTLHTQDHPFIKWPTCMAYGQAEIFSVADLERYLAAGTAQMREPMGRAVLSLVVDGYLASDFTKNRVRDFVKARRAARSG